VFQKRVWRENYIRSGFSQVEASVSLLCLVSEWRPNTCWSFSFAEVHAVFGFGGVLS
jgi:hypothetical protein